MAALARALAGSLALCSIFMSRIISSVRQQRLRKRYRAFDHAVVIPLPNCVRVCAPTRTDQRRASRPMVTRDLCWRRKCQSA